MLLSYVAHAFHSLTTSVVSPSYFPFVYGSTLHAARVSIAFQFNARKNQHPHSWGTYVVGYLIMAWGGSVISHILLSLPPPQLYSIQPYINYLTVHFFLTAFFQQFPSALNPRILDTLLFPLDAALRVNSIASTVAMLSPISAFSGSINPLLAGSPLTHCILGAVASSGGGQTASMLNVWSDTWSLSPPAFLRGTPVPGLKGWFVGSLDTLDVWGGALIAVIYDVLTGHPAFLGSEGLHTLLDFTDLETSKFFSPLSAKAACCIILSFLFGIRIFWVHHWSIVPQTVVLVKKKKSKVQ
ncbi:hypothetical protein PLEOSDRAFT_1049235 [Pleurotus ostreatus PC15]|uniref:Uncharacterized protein n=1 Tax=Pleurotus ostreatus (strain PC15) TaxID=1137138 RepID=A0A067N613_PLEO1|nr:hypothetical protein PLEOSDRAFT_1049235 [Pleurotus ostreatus PC15]